MTALAVGAALDPFERVATAAWRQPNVYQHAVSRRGPRLLRHGR